MKQLFIIRTFILVILTVVSVRSYAQSGTIMGIVKDAEKHLPVVGCSISILNTPIIAGTDDNGRFTVSIPAHTDSLKLVLAGKGFKPDTVDIIAGQDNYEVF